MVLLPAPVLPTTPIFSPYLTLNDRSCKTVSRLGLYFSPTFLNSIFPYSGHKGLFSSNLGAPFSNTLS